MKAVRIAKVSVAGLLALFFNAACTNDQSKPLLPPPGFTGDAVQGKAIFLDNCARCHGRNARGTPRFGPPLINQVYEPTHHPDLSFYRAVRDGVRQHHWNYGNMPAVEGVEPKEVAHVIAFIRGEQRKAGIF